MLVFVPVNLYSRVHETLAKNSLRETTGCCRELGQSEVPHKKEKNRHDRSTKCTCMGISQ